MVKVSRIQVSDLFGRFNHTLAFKDNERIAIMIGPNGFGKTMMLRMIDVIFNDSLDNLSDMPFRHLEISFDDNAILAIEKFSSTSDDKPPEHDLCLTYRSKQGRIEYSFNPEPPNLSQGDVRLLSRHADDLIPYVERIDVNTWVDTQLNERITLPKMLRRYHTYLTPLSIDIIQPLPEWLEELRDTIPVRFIRVDRLMNTHVSEDIDADLPFRRRPTPVMQRTVKVYSDDIGKQVKQKLIEYGSISQERDRTFPGRLVQEIDKSPLSDSELHGQLSKIEEKRTQIVEAGLIPQDNPEWRGTALNRLEVNAATKGVMAVYARDAQDKLSVFDELLGKVQTLKRIANARFLHKEIAIGEEGIKIRSNGSQLDLEMLSSGEQHELAIIYNLLFRIRKDSLILIDEPELSLHVAWQKQFLRDLEDMAILSDFQALIATHSPQIINDRWGLTIELKDPDA